MAECKTCKWYGVKPDARGRFVVRKDTVAQCVAPDPEEPRLPSSMTHVAYGWRWPPVRRYMSPSDGADCPTYAFRQKD